MKLLMFILLIVAAYTYIDNNRIKIVSENIKIEKLPDVFDGFTILQIGDLHGKRFGHEQKNLIEKINCCNYDMIAITGDMLNCSNNDTKPFIELLDGIKNKQYIFYISGNNDPPYTDGNNENKNEIGVKLEEKGCKFIDEPYPIQRGKNTMWICSFFIKNNLNSLSPNISKDDIKIALSHYPMDEAFYEGPARILIPDYDLILAGHYHGGQCRIPFYGALLVPKLNKLEIFPKQSAVSGLMKYGNYKQYVSRGLGASSKIPFLRFRLFNTPEINLITLVKEK